MSEKTEISATRSHISQLRDTTCRRLKHQQRVHHIALDKISAKAARQAFANLLISAQLPPTSKFENALQHLDIGNAADNARRFPVPNHSEDTVVRQLGCRR